MSTIAWYRLVHFPCTSFFLTRPGLNDNQRSIPLTRRSLSTYRLPSQWCQPPSQRLRQLLSFLLPATQTLCRRNVHRHTTLKPRHRATRRPFFISPHRRSNSNNHCSISNSATRSPLRHHCSSNSSNSNSTCLLIFPPCCSPHRRTSSAPPRQRRLWPPLLSLRPSRLQSQRRTRLRTRSRMRPLEVHTLAFMRRAPASRRQMPLLRRPCSCLPTCTPTSRPTPPRSRSRSSRSSHRRPRQRIRLPNRSLPCQSNSHRAPTRQRRRVNCRHTFTPTFRRTRPRNRCSRRRPQPCQRLDQPRLPHWRPSLLLTSVRLYRILTWLGKPRRAPLRRLKSL